MRISVSDLECWRRYRDNEDVSLDDCLKQLRRETPPTRPMLAGRALHSILEHSQIGDESVNAERDGFRFYFHCDIELPIPAIRELKGETNLETPSGPVTLVGVVDGMNGAVYDYKLTGRFDAERLTTSYQWRCYLMMFGAHKFIYRVFVGQEQNELYSIWEYHELPFYRYPGLEGDVQQEVAACARFFKLNGLGLSSRATALLG